MRNAIRLGTRGLAGLLLIAVSASGTENPPPAKCCFTNPHYTGTCEVVPAKDETCAQVLEYLNSPMSQGKTYCGNTTIRGDWESVACQPAK